METPSLKAKVIIVDNFCPMYAEVAQSAHAAGLGSFTPNKGLVGTSVYKGMGFHGLHAPMIRAINESIGYKIVPNLMFFRESDESTNTYIHSDRTDGSYTCVAYLSAHKGKSGTAFYHHKPSGMSEMPCLHSLHPADRERLCREMETRDSHIWQQTDFVSGLLNRAVIFSAPLYHSRIPHGGTTAKSIGKRLVWVCHFELG